MGQFATVIAELEKRREKIGAAIDALKELDDIQRDLDASLPDDQAVVARIPLAKGTRKVKAVKIGERKAKPGGTRERVLEVLEDGPQASGAVVACVNAGGRGPAASAVYAMLNYLKSKGEITRGKDGVWSLAK